MLPVKNRLKKKKDFENVFKRGKKIEEDFLCFRFIKTDLKSPRFGFVVGKSYSNKAVDRNKIKRRIRDVIKNNLSDIIEIIDGVIIVRPAKKNIEFEELEKKILNLLIKSKIIKK